VGTARHAFGVTPVSVRLRAGKTYAFIFSREGYKPTTKALRVTEDGEQEVVATLKKAPPPSRAIAAPAAAPESPAPAPPPAKPADKTWFQRMFGGNGR
jgi:hypothetical protein